MHVLNPLLNPVLSKRCVIFANAKTMFALNLNPGTLPKFRSQHEILISGMVFEKKRSLLIQENSGEILDLQFLGKL